MRCRKSNERIAVKLQELSQKLEQGEDPEKVRQWSEIHVLAPLGLQVPDRGEGAT